MRPAGRPNKACIHGPGDLCLCAHYFPLTWLKAAVPRRQKCSCQGSGNGRTKCQCGGGNAAAAAAASTPEDDTQPIFYQDLVARGLQVTTEPVDLDVPATAPGSCCSRPSAAAPAPAPMAGSCCSGGSNQPAPMAPAHVSAPAPAPAPATSSCCGGGIKSESASSTNGHIKRESLTTAPFTPIQQFQPPPDFPVMKFSPNGGGAAADHVCNCGPTCNCVLCIDHPYNNATMNHIATEFGQMMSSGAQQFSPGSSTNGRSGSRPDLSWQGWNGMMPPGFNDASFLNSQPQQTHSPPQHASDMDIILNPADFQMFNFAWPPPGGEEDGVPQQQHHQFEDAGPELSLDMMDLNGFCGGAPEGCPCGDECACIGCQIHKPTNGHEVTSGHVNGLVPPGWG